MEIEGKAYDFLVGGDVGRDGAYVEIADLTSGTREVVAELFCPHGKPTMLLTLWREYLPIQAVEEATRIARCKELVGR
jgi:hypothetical protein